MNRRSLRRVCFVAALVAVVAAAFSWGRSLGTVEPGERAPAADAGPPSLVGVGDPGSALAGARASTEGSDGPAPPSPEAPRKILLQGVTVDEQGRPLPDVEILVPGRPEAVGAPAPPVVARSAEDGTFRFAWTEETSVKARAEGRVLVETEVYLEPGVPGRLVLVRACHLRVRVLEEETGLPVREALVRVIAGFWSRAVFGNDLEIPFADEARTDAEGRTSLGSEGGTVNVLVVPREHAPVSMGFVNVPPEGRDLEVRVGRGGLVEGRVLDPEGQVVAGATVRLDLPPLQRQEVTTDASGRFHFRAVGRPGALPYADRPPLARLVARASGWGFGEAVLTPPAPGTTTRTDLVLRPARWVRGTVRTWDGVPVEGALVDLFVLTKEGEGAHAVGHPRFGAPTDAEGRFAFEEVPGGSSVEVWMKYPPFDAQLSIEVPLEDDPPPLDLRLPDPRGRVTVRVLDAHRDLVAGARVLVRSGPPVLRTVAEGTTDQVGSVSFEGLPTETATLWVRAPASTTIERDLDAEALADGEVVVVLEGGVLSGVVRRADGSHAPVALRLERPLGACMDFGLPCETDAEGRFAFRHLPDDRFALGLEDPALVLITFMPWARTGETDLELWVADVTESARYRFEVILLDDAMGGTLAHLQGVSADLTPVGGTRGPKLTAELLGGGGEPGRFVMPEPTAPGTYDVTLTALGWRTVHLPSQRIPRQGPIPTVRLDRGGRLEGRALTAEGEPLAGVRIGVGGQGAVSDEAGAFRLSGLEAGTFEARAQGDFVQPEGRSVTLPWPAGGGWDWVLRPAGALEIRLETSARAGTGERVRATPLSGGAMQDVVAEGPLEAWSGGEVLHGARFPGLAPGRYRVEAWQGPKTWPAQEVDVPAGTWTIVRVGP